MRRFLSFFGLLEGTEDPVHARGGRTTPTVIGETVALKGELHGEGDLLILGRFEGDIVLRGALTIGAGARVDANITATDIFIGGEVRGNLSAETMVEIGSTGALTGTVRSASFSAAEGAAVKGEIWVERAAAAERVAP